MKKGLLVAAGVIALLVIMVWADKKFPAAGRPAGSSSTPATNTSEGAVALKDMEGHDVTLGQYQGKVVLVNFWATWCEPCRTEIPWMIDFQKKYSSRGFTILGISMDEEGKKAVEPFLAKERFDVAGQKEAINYPIVLGNQNLAEKFGGIMGLPTSMLYTRDGKKIKTIVGIVNRDEMAKVIESML
jgi:thiol-disulfide isomerase/thioredoxin